MKRAVFHPEASQEYLQAIEYYVAISIELGDRFDSEIQRLVSEVSRDPQRFFGFHPPARRALSLEFPYSVVYLDEPDHVWIVGRDARQTTIRLLEETSRMKAAKAPVDCP